MKPEAASIGLLTLVQVDGNNLFDQYRGCPGATEQLPLPLGVLSSQGCGLPTPLPAKIYCKFGNQAVLATYVSSTVIDSFMCMAPATVTSTGQFSVSVSLNGEPAEYSNTLYFTFANPIIETLFPSTGSGGGGGTLLIRGQGFVDVPQLSCLFYPTTASMITDGTITTGSVSRKAIYINPNEVRCVMPAAWEFPLKCACNCFQTICTTPLMRYNVSSYDFTSLSQMHATATTTASDVTLPIQQCTSTTELLCNINVTLGLNLYQLPPSVRLSVTFFLQSLTIACSLSCISTT